MEESASAKIQKEAITSIKNEHQHASWVIDIPTREERVKLLSSPECCIYKVPDSLRKLNEEAYSPHVISIGPFHHGNEKLKTMENYKAKYLEAFIERAKINKEDLKNFVKDLEGSVSQCYAETITLSGDDFVTMIMTDASIIIELFFRNWFQAWTTEDWIVLKPWLALRMQLDFILLENQLPFFIFEKLFDHLASVSKFEVDNSLTVSASRPRPTSFIELSFEYFKFYNRQNMSPNHFDPELKILHFVDLLRSFYLPLDHLPYRVVKTVEHMYSATQLERVGLKFEVDLSSNCLLELELDRKKKVLKIPRFTFDNDMELCVRNLLALEQCCYPNETYITDYFILLDFLINRAKDLDLLRQQAIVVNRSSKKHETYFINDLCTGITYSTMSSKYYDICTVMKCFYESPSQRWMVSLKRDYFGSPWKAASTIAAIVLLILTSIQTVCSLLSL